MPAPELPLARALNLARLVSHGSTVGVVVIERELANNSDGMSRRGRLVVTGKDVDDHRARDSFD